MGKRGGIRVIYHLVKSAGLVLMLAAYAKNVKENLSNDEKKPSVASPKPSKKASPKVSLGDLIIRGYEEGIAYAKGELSA